MKRQQQQQQYGIPTVATNVPEALEMAGRSIAANNNDGEMISLLREIRDELRENNEAIKTMKEKNKDVEESVLQF